MEVLKLYQQNLLIKQKGLFGQALQNALEEGLEEIIQYPVENAGQKIAYDKNMPFFSTKQDAIINPGEMAKAGFIGGVGGIMGGGAQVINNSINKNYQKNLNIQYETIISRLP